MKDGSIGLGAMGSGIALNLRKARYDMVIFDLLKDAGASQSGYRIDRLRIFSSRRSDSETQSTVCMSETEIVTFLSCSARLRISKHISWREPAITEQPARGHTAADEMSEARVKGFLSTFGRSRAVTSLRSQGPTYGWDLHPQRYAHGACTRKRGALSGRRERQ